jgi:hypothetical protein
MISQGSSGFLDHGFLQFLVVVDIVSNGKDKKGNKGDEKKIGNK